MSVAESEVYVRADGSALLIHPDYKGRVTVEWFGPDYWKSRACPVGSGGRGGAWFIDDEGEPLVLRKYRRGGMIARLSESSYVFLGERRVRSFAEFRLLNRLAREGLPVPQPVAAMYQRSSTLGYQAAILIRKIEGSQPLADLVGSLDANAWSALGQRLRQFHDFGVYHADLNCYNVLVRDGGFYLIDFDKGRLIPGGRGPARWKQANLRRLHRSLTRLDWPAANISLANCWAALLSGYGND